MDPLLTGPVFAISALAAGTALILFPGRYRRRAEERHSSRLAELEAGAEESYFEEKRSLLAYRPIRSDRGWRGVGALLILIGLYLLFRDA